MSQFKNILKTWGMFALCLIPSLVFAINTVTTNVVFKNTRASGDSIEFWYPQPQFGNLGVIDVGPGSQSDTNTYTSAVIPQQLNFPMTFAFFAVDKSGGTLKSCSLRIDYTVDTDPVTGNITHIDPALSNPLVPENDLECSAQFAYTQPNMITITFSAH